MLCSPIICAHRMIYLRLTIDSIVIWVTSLKVNYPCRKFYLMKQSHKFSLISCCVNPWRRTIDRRLEVVSSSTGEDSLNKMDSRDDAMRCSVLDDERYAAHSEELRQERTVLKDPLIFLNIKDSVEILSFIIPECCLTISSSCEFPHFHVRGLPNHSPWTRASLAHQKTISCIETALNGILCACRMSS